MEDELLSTIAALLVYECQDVNNTMVARFMAEDLHRGGVLRLTHYCTHPATKPKHVVARALARQLTKPDDKLTQNDGVIESTIYESDTDEDDPYDNPMIKGKWEKAAGLRVFQRLQHMFTSATGRAEATEADTKGNQGFP
ncbi:MAG: hypothetical protein ABEI52_13355 [Halobacteriaceae archaeon]